MCKPSIEFLGRYVSSALVAYRPRNSPDHPSCASDRHAAILPAGDFDTQKRQDRSGTYHQHAPRSGARTSCGSGLSLLSWQFEFTIRPCTREHGMVHTRRATRTRFEAERCSSAGSRHRSWRGHSPILLDRQATCLGTRTNFVSLSTRYTQPVAVRCLLTNSIGNGE